MLDSSCEICQAILRSRTEGVPVGESFRWFNGVAVYDIDKARQIVADGREVFECDTHKLAGFVSYTGVPGTFNVLTTAIAEEHIDHVSDSKDDPIIIASFLKPRADEPQVRSKMPIDGHHRIAKAIKYKQPLVYVVMLSEDETDQILTDNRPPLRKKRRK